jgi:predicted Zn-dependent peptidase
MDAIRERRALVYYAGCSADLLAQCGQFTIEATTAPKLVDELFAEVARLLVEHTGRIDAVGLERARNQLAVRAVRAQERPFRRLEDAAQGLFTFGRLRSRAEAAARVEAVTPAQVRAAFERMLAVPSAVAIAGKVSQGAGERFHALVAAGRGRALPSSAPDPA